MAILTRKATLVDFCWSQQIFGEEGEAGRILHSCGRGLDGREASLWNVHNFDLKGGTVRKVGGLIQAELREGEDIGRKMLWVGGDWNFLASGETRFTLTRPEGNFHEHPPKKVRTMRNGAKRWSC